MTTASPYNRRRFLRLLVRFQNAVDAAEARSAEAASIDAAFDAGEFSGPACRRAFERESDRLAQRFGFADADLAYAAVGLVGATLHQPAILHGFPAALPQ
jgi:hypothetical protein